MLEPILVVGLVGCSLGVGQMALGNAFTSAVWELMQTPAAQRSASEAPALGLGMLGAPLGRTAEVHAPERPMWVEGYCHNHE